MFWCKPNCSVASCKQILWLLAGLAGWSATAAAGGGYVLGINAEIDTADGRVLSGFVDYGFTEDTWLSAALARSDTDAVAGGLDAVYAELALEHTFGVVGVRIGGAYWGDNDILDSTDIRGSIFLRGKKASLSFDFEQREFDFLFRPILEPERVRKVEFSADGLGANASLQTGKRTRIFASGMSYDYSINIRLQPRIELLNRLSLSRLSLINSLIDYRVSGGFEFRFDKLTLDLTVSNWRTAIDGGQVNSVALGFITPIGPTSDLGVRLAWDKSENFGDTVALAVSLYYFGK